MAALHLVGPLEDWKHIKKRKPLPGYVLVVYRGGKPKKVVKPEEVGKLAEYTGWWRFIEAPGVGELKGRFVSTTEKPVQLVLRDLTTNDGHKVEQLTMRPTIRINPDRLIGTSHDGRPGWAETNDLGELENNLVANLTRDVGLWMREAYLELSTERVMQLGESIVTQYLNARLDSSPLDHIPIFRDLLQLTSLGIVTDVKYSDVMRTAFESKARLVNEIAAAEGEKQVALIKVLAESEQAQVRAMSVAEQAKVLGIPPLIAQNPTLLEKYMEVQRDIAVAAAENSRSRVDIGQLLQATHEMPAFAVAAPPTAQTALPAPSAAPPSPHQPGALAPPPAAPAPPALDIDAELMALWHRALPTVSGVAGLGAAAAAGRATVVVALSRSLSTRARRELEAVVASHCGATTVQVVDVTDFRDVNDLISKVIERAEDELVDLDAAVHTDFDGAAYRIRVTSGGDHGPILTRLRDVENPTIAALESVLGGAEVIV